MRPSAPRAALIVALVALTAPRAATAQATTGIGPADAVPYVEAVGTGQVKLPPDRATVIVGVETRATNAAAASAATGKIQRAVLDTLRAALARGATSAGNVEYSLSHADSAQQAALTRAVADAQRQAAAIASALGGSLGAVIMTTTHGQDEGGIAYRMGYNVVGDAFGTGPSIKPAEISVDATVVVRWRYLFR